MAFPTILVNSATGSDTAASGAGPGTAITGSTGRTRNTASQLQFGLFGATDDLSGVATDGSHVLFASISTAGQRNFSSIAATKNTRQTGSDGAITSGTAILTVGSTTGWAVGDVVKVTGAGAASADLYSTVLTVDSATQATLNDNAGTTVGPSAAWENPKQVTLTTGQGLNTGTTNTTWAIGGKRASIGSTTSKKLADNNSAAGDTAAGWIVEMESGHAETIAATYNIRRAGSATDGPVTWRGTPGAGTKPILTFSNNGSAILLNADIQHISGFEMRNTNATKTASLAISTLSGTATIRNMKLGHATNYFRIGIQVGPAGSKIVDCEILYCGNVGIDVNTAGVTIRNCWIHNCGSHAISQPTGGTSGMIVTGCILAGNAGDGFNFAQSAAGFGSPTEFSYNTVDSNTGDGVEITQNLGATSRGHNALNIQNNIFSNNGGYGVNMSGTGVTDAGLLASMFEMVGNTFYNNTGGKYNPTSITVSRNEQTSNPSYTNAAAGDYSIGTALKATGYPVGGVNTVSGFSTTPNYVDPGASQRLESGSGGSANLLQGKL